jgi:hypothetical protein
MFGAFRLWTFGSCSVLIDAMRRFGFDEWTEIEDFASEGLLRRVKRKKLSNLQDGCSFAAIMARPVIEARSGGTITATLEVSPFDDRFPTIDWRADLPQARHRRRRSIGSRISALYLRDLREYPSALTIQINVSSPSVLDATFRSFCASIPEVLKGINDVAGAGLLTSDGFVLPPESLASRIEQLPELRAKVDGDYPVVYISSRATSPSGGLWLASDELTSGMASVALPAELRIEAMPEGEYRRHLATRGVFETPDGALVLGDRQSHKLHALAEALYSSTNRTLCPMTNAVLDRSLGLAASRRPFLLVDADRCRKMSACIEAYSEKALGPDREGIVDGLAHALTTCIGGIGPDTSQILRTALT